MKYRIKRFSLKGAAFQGGLLADNKLKKFSKRDEQIAHNQRVTEEYVKEVNKLDNTELGKRVNQKWKKYNNLVEDYAKNSKYTKEDKAEGRKVAKENLKFGLGQLTVNTHGKYKYPLKERLKSAGGAIKSTGYVYRSTRDGARYNRIDQKLRYLSPERDPDSIKYRELGDKILEKYNPKYVKVDPQ